MSDPYPDLEPWEAYETACQRIAYLEAQLAEAHDVITAARCIRHWHDREPDGMIVSADAVRELWAALSKYERALLGEESE